MLITINVPSRDGFPLELDFAAEFAGDCQGSEAPSSDSGLFAFQLYIAPQHEALLTSGVNGLDVVEDPARASIDLLSNSRGALF